MKKKILAVMPLLFLVTSVVATEYIINRGGLYDFVMNYQGTEAEMHDDLEYMCENAVIRSVYYDRYDDIEITGYSTGQSYQWVKVDGKWTIQLSDWTTSMCGVKYTYTRYSSYYGEDRTYRSYSSIWFLKYRDTTEGREVKMWGYYPGGGNTYLIGKLPLPE